MGSKNQRLELTWYNKDKALIPAAAGKYGYTWVSPRDPRYCETHTLIFDETVIGERAPLDEKLTYSDNANVEPTEDNLLIHGESGDVLEALTRVPELASKYVGQVKCVYIDPPFNTEQTFEHYEDNLEHSIWLTMMRDRLIHLRRLLSVDGSIWVHLDTNENHRMRALLDEVFGAGNFIAEVAWQKLYAPENRSIFTQSHDFIVLYAKNKECFKATRNLLSRSVGQDAAYKNPDNDPRGPWKPGDFTAQLNKKENARESQLYTLVTPAGNRYEPPVGGCWRFTQARYEELLADNRVAFGANGDGRPALKRFKSEVMQGRVPDSWWDYKSVGHSQDAKKELIKLFPTDEPFATPKPERLIERVLQIATNPGDLVIDVFGGSGTTAAVAHKMGRRWITCELVEETFNRYTKERLTKVVKGQDMGGVSIIAGERLDATENGLPEGMTPEDAMKLTSLLNKAVKDNEELKSSDTLKAIKALVKTKKSPALVNWRGGGSFKVAHLSPSCFNYDEELQFTMLTDAAMDEGTLIRSVAAQMGFYLTPKHPVFHGVKGSMRLYVTRTPISSDLAAEIADNLEPGERVTIASTSVLDGGRKVLREKSKGSRVVHIPDDLFGIDEEGGF